MRFALLLLFFTSTIQAQICVEDSIPETVSTENFDFSTSGVATDRIHGLTWQRCAYGMTWNAVTATCEGTPQKLTWQDALLKSTTDPALVGAGWRLPNFKEILTVIDYQCFIPPLNAELFPNAPAAINSGFWTSTPVQNTPTPTKVRAWLIELGYGQLQQENLSVPQYVIYVRP